MMVTSTCSCLSSKVLMTDTDPPGSVACTKGHAKRCAMSITPAKQCRCACGGRFHGRAHYNGGLLRLLRKKNLLDYLYDSDTAEIKKPTKKRKRKKSHD